VRKLFKLGCVVLFAVLVIEPSHASVADAQRLYAAGKYSEAWKEFDRYAKVGDPASQYAVASMYYNGQGVEKNLLLAFAWWTLAAEQKYKDAAGLSKMAQKKMTPEELASLEEKFSDLYALYGGDSLMETIYPAIIPENLTKKIVFSTEYQNIEGLQYQEDAELEASAESSDEDAFVKMLEHKSTAPNVRTSAYMLQADFTIAPDGSVRDYEPVFRYGRTEYAAAKVRELKFKPATFDGKPVFVDVRKGFGLLDADAPILSKINLHENYHHLYRALTNSKNLSTQTTATVVVTPSDVSNITVTAPNGGEQWQSKSVKTITWNYSNATINSKVDLYLFLDSKRELLQLENNEHLYKALLPS